MWSAVLPVVLILHTNFGVHSAEDLKSPVVTSPSGSFLGSYLTSRRGRPINSFRGIRYAEPPVDQLRFQPPQLITSYSSQVNATVDGPACPQPGTWLDEPSEDCLRLNVYSPSVTENKTLPVLVYFHAGGLYSVSGQSFIEGPQYLLDHNLTLVTVNYRLASLGFISTGDKWAPGNAGFKDQVAALRWIQQNIASFGGDPDNVSIFGYSAGSLSVTLHMLSPMSKGLFHRAIAMSGAGTNQWTVPEHQYDLAAKQARLLDCSDTSSEEIISCLKTKNATDLGESLSSFYEFAGQDPIWIWYPVVEPDLGQERFLPDHPVNLIRDGQIHDVPLIIGITELEFTGQAFNVLINETYTEQLNDDWNTLAPIIFSYNSSTETSEELKEFYVGNETLQYTNDTAFALGRLYGDAVIAFGSHRFTELMVENLKSPVYNYKFNYTGDQSHYYYPNTTTPIGAVHHDDLIYLFNISRIFTPITLDSPHSEMVDKMTTMWANFATTGDPNSTGEEPVLANLTWPAQTSSERQYLQINKEFQVRYNMHQERFQLWETLFPLET